MDGLNKHYVECYRVDSNRDFFLTPEQIEVSEGFTSMEDICWEEIPDDAVVLKFYDQKVFNCDDGREGRGIKRDTSDFIFIGTEYTLEEAKKVFPEVPFIEYAEEMNWDRLVMSDNGSWHNLEKSDKVAKRP